MSIRSTENSRSLVFLAVAAWLALGLPSAALAADQALAFAVSGVVAEVKVKAGDQVQAGQPLAVLDTRPFQARKRAADAAVKATRIVLDLADLRLTQVKELFDALSASAEQVEEAQIAQAQAMMAHENAKAQAVIAAWELERATLAAPFAGAVAAVPGYAGQVVNVNVGAQPVVVINRP